jgi:MFS family permease
MALGFIWIIGASILGFTIAAIFAGWLRLRRNIYLLFYIPLVTVFFLLFIRSNNLNFRELIIYNWYWWILGAALASVFVIKNVLSQPYSERQKGYALISDIVWPGLAYGVCDALLLSVLPILTVRIALSETGWMNGLMGKIGFGMAALIASLFVTAIYHLGYPEFRGKKVLWPLIGNGVLSVAYLLTMNPLAAILPHIGMHITAMVHGRETTGQVPPHYND